MARTNVSSRSTSDRCDTPEVEILRGAEIPKMSPRRTHAVLQGEMYALLRAWAPDEDVVGTEWRFNLPLSGEERTSLVPDVSYVSAAALRSLTKEEVEEPPIAPAIAVEIRSPGDREANIAAKTRLYLAAGTRLVLDVDPASRTIIALDALGSSRFTDGAAFAHDTVPGLHFDVGTYFNRAVLRSTSLPRD